MSEAKKVAIGVVGGILGVAALFSLVLMIAGKGGESAPRPQPSLAEETKPVPPQSEQPREPDSTPAVAIQTRQEGRIGDGALRIPADVSYRIVEDVLDSPYLPYKRSVSVRLNKKVSLDVLRAIVLEVKARENPKVERHIVCFYLPGWDDIKQGCWAASDDLSGPGDARILGLTQEQEDFYRREPIPPGLDL